MRQETQFYRVLDKIRVHLRTRQLIIKLNLEIAFLDLIADGQIAEGQRCVPAFQIIYFCAICLLVSLKIAEVIVCLAKVIR